MQQNIIDEIKLNNHIEKLKCLIKIQKDNFEHINDSVNKLSTYYKTTNTNKLLEVNKIQEYNYINLNNSLDKYINVINHTISKYNKTIKETEQNFEDIL